MVTLKRVVEHNAALKRHNEGLTAVLVGATSGIGLATLTAMVKHLSKPSLYVVGRSAKRFAPELSKLQSLNPAATITFLEVDISLLTGADHAAKVLTEKITQLDLLYLSPGFLGFGGPHYTKEGLDTCFVLSHYTRIRLITLLLPLLNAAPRPRVLSVLAGGHERLLFTQDGDLGLSLDNGRNYNAIRAVEQLTTLHTLTLMHLTSAWPRVSFLHVHPGWVVTDFLPNLLSTAGIAGAVLKRVLVPVYRMVATSEEDSGERQLFHATSCRYPSREMLRSAQYDPEDVATCHGPYTGFYRVLADGGTASGGTFLQSLELQGWPEKAMRFTEDTISQVLRTVSQKNGS